MLRMPIDAPPLRTAVELYGPGSRKRMAALLEDCRSAGTAFDEVADVSTADGQLLRVRTMGQAVLNAAGDVTGLHGVVQDLGVQRDTQLLPPDLTKRLATTLASISEAFVTLDATGRFTYVNQESVRLLNATDTNLLQQLIWEKLDASGTGTLREHMQVALASQRATEFETLLAPTQRWLELRTYPFEDGLAVYLRDVTDRRRTQEQLLLLQTSISRLNDVVLITEAGPLDSPGPRIVFVNDAFERLTGYSRSEVLGGSPRILQGARTLRIELDRIRDALEQEVPVRADLVNYRKGGEAFWLELEIVPVQDARQKTTHWVAIGRDITKRKATEEEIEHLAFYDALTQLPNRQLLMECLRQTLTRREHHDRIGALMFIDLDDFKILNDTKGHATGDLLLQKVAQRLRTCVRLRDTVARLGGDEFVVLLDDLGDDSDAAQEKARVVAEKILASLADPYELSSQLYDGTCSIGITLIHQHQRSMSDLLKQADLAMYQAKAQGRNGICFFDPVMQARATANAALTAQLRQGVRAREFVLYYQPQVGPKGLMVGAEALMRWNHPERGLLLPSLFIPQAEESGLILPMGQWALETACAQLAVWAQSPHTERYNIAVNVSVRQFRHPLFVEQVLAAIAHAGISPRRLKLELTESLFAQDTESTITRMGALKDAGVTLSIDDFGIGYSALSYLKYLPLDQLKIDRTFVKDVLTDPNDAAIARTIIGLSQSLGLGVMAEGVETQAQRDFLAEHGCHCFQGHLFCKPLPVDELDVFIRGLPQ